MKSERLRHSIVIERPVDIRTPSGGFDQSWEVFASVRALVRPLSGREQHFASQTYPTANLMVELRYYPGITSKMRVKFVPSTGATPRYLAIEFVQNVNERNVDMMLTCTEKV
jgi:SPP1 family predicted phage head-tail adaptor